MAPGKGVEDPVVMIDQDGARWNLVQFYRCHEPVVESQEVPDDVPPGVPVDEIPADIEWLWCPGEHCAGENSCITTGSKEVTVKCPKCGHEEQCPICDYVPCDVAGCEQPAAWEGWHRVFDIAGLPTGLIRRVNVCEEHKVLLVGDQDELRREFRREE